MDDNFTPGAAHDSDLSDTDILCIDCNVEFVWTAGEQQFFRDKGLQNPPKRCRTCKQAKNERLSAANSATRNGVKEKVEVTVTCARCEKNTTVPFYPSQGRPVLCRSCFLEQNPEILSPNNS
jgi:CxxC-x17-CxxC domain-containing protein